MRVRGCSDTVAGTEVHSTELRFKSHYLSRRSRGKREVLHCVRNCAGSVYERGRLLNLDVIYMVARKVLYNGVWDGSSCVNVSKTKNEMFLNNASFLRT